MTDEDVKAANEALVESMVRQLRDCASVGDEMTLDDACLLDDAADWIAGEPARIAAAREEQREADARFFEATMEQAHDLERDDVDPVTAIRATPLTATPLADEIAALKARIVEAVRYWTDLAQAEARDAAAARARVAELEAAYAAVSPETIEKWRNGEMAMGELISFGHETGLKARVAELERERDEAVAALRGLLRDEWHTYEGNLEASGRASVDDLNAARAVLAKYPEGR